MTITPDILRERLQLALNESPLDATELARRLGRGTDYVRDFLNGRKDSLKAPEIVKLESILSVETGFFTGASAKQIGVSNSVISSDDWEKVVGSEVRHIKFKKMIFDDISKLKINLQLGLDPDFKILPSREGPNHVSVVSLEPIETVVRPWFMKEVAQGYAIQVVDERMEPAFEPGDLAIINPKASLMRNKNCILISDRGEREFRSAIFRLLRWNETHWFVRQFNPPLDLELSRDEWPEAFRVISRLDG